MRSLEINKKKENLYQFQVKRRGRTQRTTEHGMGIGEKGKEQRGKKEPTSPIARRVGKP